ncbi:MAG: ATP-binding protein [Alphaproteobacteria bacterium]
MLRIYRYLALASAVLLFLSLVLIAWFYHHQATRDLVRMATGHSIAVDRILSNTIWSHYQDHLAAAEQMHADALRAHPATAEIDHLIKMITEGVQILKVKIYSADGVIVFSTDPAEIGEDYSDSTAFQAAVREGRSSSELSYKDRFSAFSGELFDRAIVETYLPKYDGEGNVTGVIELYADVTDVDEQIDSTTIRLTIGLIAIFGVIYTVLVVGIMRRAIEPIRLASRRAAEIGPRASGVRLPVSDMPAEILPLVLATNDAFDRLDRALDAQRRFTADAAHELLTPLAVLRAQIDALDADSIAEPLRDDVDAMTDMVSQLLYLSEIESDGEAAGGEERADLHGAAVDVISMLAPLAIRDGKQLALTGAAGPVLVKGSALALSRALRNLIENALGHTPANTTVGVDLGADGSIRVSDQGPGVPPDERAAVFQRFWRGAGKTGPGAGLGLSIVKRIVENAGGEIWIEDAPGGGACFVVQLARASHATGAETSMNSSG